MQQQRITVEQMLTGKYRPFIVAELSGNHQQDISLARRMIEAAAVAGVDAVKLQTYTADTMTLPCHHNEFLITESNNLWKGQSLHSLYGRASTPWEWHDELFKLAKDLGLSFFSSPFDSTAVDFLETLNVPCYKIASFELTDIPLIRYIAATRKPLIMSTGMASQDEIAEAVSVAREAGARDIVLLKCTSTYPATPGDTNLRTLAHLATSFGCKVGLSDHTQGIGVAVASVGFDVCLIEKHFTLDRSAGGVDAEFSMEPNELAQLVIEVGRAHAAMGEVHYGGSAAEQDSKRYRRSVYFSRSLAKGSIVSPQDIRVVRPAFGLHPRYYDEVMGKILLHDVVAGTPVNWQHFEEIPVQAS